MFNAGAFRMVGWILGIMLVIAVMGAYRLAGASGPPDPQVQAQEAAQDGRSGAQAALDDLAERGIRGLASRAVDVVQANPDAFLVCLLGMVGTLIFTQYRKPFVKQGRERWVASLRLESATFGSAATALMLWALFHWGSDAPAGAEFVAALILAPLTGFGTPLAYDLVLWRLVDKFIGPRRPE